MEGNSPTLITSDIENIRVPARSNRMRTLLGVSLVLTDVVMVILAFVLAHQLVQSSRSPSVADLPRLLQYTPIIVLNCLAIVLMFYFTRLYHLRRTGGRLDQMRSIVGVVTLGVLLASALQTFFFGNTQFEVGYPRTLLLYVWFFSVVLVTIGRELHGMLKNSLRTRGIATENLIVVGSDSIAREITGRIMNNPALGYELVGVVNNGNGNSSKTLGVPVIGTYKQLPDLIDEHKVEQVIIAVPSAKRAELVELVRLCQRGRVDIKVYPDIFAYMAGDLNVDELGGVPLLTVRDIALRGWKLSLKRGLDIFGSVCGLIVLSPFILLTGILIRLESRGSVFYTQMRMGLDGRPFPMIKFRSMQVDAEAEGPGWTTEDDPRVTQIGKWLRKTNWDEIPQLINVLLGHMSLVGPRPERPVYVHQFRQDIPRYMERHREKAGMTGWAQVNGLRGDTSIPERTTYDLWYVENWSLWLDLKIIFRTVLQTLLRRDRNAY